MAGTHEQHSSSTPGSRNNSNSSTAQPALLGLVRAGWGWQALVGIGRQEVARPQRHLAHDVDPEQRLGLRPARAGEVTLSLKTPRLTHPSAPSF